jgi:hypothetical protein
MTRTDTAMGWRDLRERIRSFGDDLEAADATCRYVLEVRHQEAREKGLQWFGDMVWSEKQFSFARAKEVTMPAGEPAAIGEAPSDPLLQVRWSGIFSSLGVDP